MTSKRGLPSRQSRPGEDGEVRRFHHIGLTVKSLDRSLDFYRDLLGFEVVFSWNPQAPYIGTLVGYPSVDLHAVVLALPGSDGRLELLEYRNEGCEPINPDNGRAGAAHIAFYVDNLDDLYARLTEAGVDSVSHPVTPTMGPNAGGRAVYMIDPDGVRVELIETARSFDDFARESG